MNESYTNECTLRYVHMCVRCSECNCTKLMHVPYFRVSSIQIGYIMRIVYTECMNEWMDVQ